MKSNHLSYLNCARAIALKIAKILANQASAQPFKNNYGASAIASKIVAPQVPTSGCPTEKTRKLSSIATFYTQVWGFISGVLKGYQRSVA